MSSSEGGPLGRPNVRLHQKWEWSRNVLYLFYVFLEQTFLESEPPRKDHKPL
ncbi:ORF175 [White spot syndrome virus]|uniref:ORF175 n=1 Tax=White spot syndrome virus TaxID=342409 RepID=A0A0X9L7R6_9VIRU|nr:ORF175 [White spot syndrome virus]ALZ45823.1 hypothetical protein [White spot syndrome virus]ASV62831.1 hypothetical protein [White spot syndrome virus]